MGYTEMGKVMAITKIFDDAYKSPLSLIILDDIERLIEYIHLGPRFSNVILQTLLVLLKKKPPLSEIGPERKLIIIGCTGLKMLLEHLDLIDCFNIPLKVPNIKTDAELSCVLNRYQAKPEEVNAIARDY